jgi:hypothetical protein
MANGHGKTEGRSTEEYQEGCESCHQEEDHFQVTEKDQNGAWQAGSQGGEEETCLTLPLSAAVLPVWLQCEFSRSVEFAPAFSKHVRGSEGGFILSVIRVSHTQSSWEQNSFTAVRRSWSPSLAMRESSFTLLKVSDGALGAHV